MIDVGAVIDKYVRHILLPPFEQNLNFVVGGRICLTQYES